MLPALRLRPSFFLVALAALALVAPACGGGGGKVDPDSQHASLALINFHQAGQDNVPINRRLKFTFSEPVSMDTVGTGSIQIRQGSGYGKTAFGVFVPDPHGDQTTPTSVFFEPVLPSFCGDYDGIGLQPGTTYKVTIIGYPEQFAVRAASGQPLLETTSYEFTTRPDTDPGYLEDQVAGQAPAVLEQYPEDGTPALPVVAGAQNEIRLRFTENLDPCSISPESFAVHVYEWGTVLPRTSVENGEEYPVGSGHWSGFVPAEDQRPDDVFSWGPSARPLADPAVCPGQRILQQDYAETLLRFVPEGGKLPENALVVVQLTFDVKDFGGAPMDPLLFSFTTENLPGNDDAVVLPFDGTMTEEVDDGETTADVNTARSPEVAQGWMLFAGGGDNGQYLNIPSFPLLDLADGTYDSCDKREPDGTKDNFDSNGGNWTFHTGTSRIPGSCTNESDGSTAVMWDFRTFHIRSGDTVTIVGLNPAIIRVQGDVVIDAGGTLRVSGGDGEDGHIFSYYDTAKDRKGGDGYAGAGDGGIGQAPTSPDWSDPGYPGYGSQDAFIKGGHGSGDGGVGIEYPTSYSYNSVGQSGDGGGGGGHTNDGQDGDRFGPISPYTYASSTPRSSGGLAYPTSSNAEELLTPSAGAGGGGGGWTSMYNNTTYYYYSGAGGGGGAGGGFVDFTSQGDIRIYGTIDARGGDGGNGAICGYTGGGGGGGGSGGAVRLLTPMNIDVSGGSILTTGGGGGKGGRGQYCSSGQESAGGRGSWGRIALEDGDSTITGMLGATLVPTDGQDGFYRGVFQASRFTGGASGAIAQTTPLLLPGQLIAPDFFPLDAADFVAGIPSGSDRGPDGTSMVVEMQGWPMQPDGTVGDDESTEWCCVGYFNQGETPTNPDWFPDALPPDAATIGYDNTLSGIGNLSGNCGYVKVRITFYTPSTNFGPSDPGPYVDDMRIRYNYDH